jgi:hypothetical protein
LKYNDRGHKVCKEYWHLGKGFKKGWMGWLLDILIILQYEIGKKEIYVGGEI